MFSGLRDMSTGRAAAKGDCGMCFCFAGWLQAYCHRRNEDGNVLGLGGRKNHDAINFWFWPKRLFESIPGFDLGY